MGDISFKTLKSWVRTQVLKCYSLNFAADVFQYINTDVRQATHFFTCLIFTGTSQN